MRGNKVRIYCGATMAMSWFLASSALAQSGQTAEVAEDVASSDATGEILVTARRVRETLQSAPAAVTALSAKTLENARVGGLEDVAKLVPNLNFFPSFRQGGFALSMRGVPTIQGGEASVAVLVDGVQAPAPDFINQDLLELSSIEVLRGPQGALYGRGAINGAVLINTVDPGAALENHFIASAGRGNSVSVTNTLSGPLAEGVGFTLTGSVRSADGLIRDTGLHEKADDSEQGSVRGKLVLTPRDSTRIDLTALYVKGVDGASYISILPVALLDQASSVYPSRNLRTEDHRELYSVSAKIQQETPIGTLTSISQYAKSRSLVLGDADYSIAPVARQRFGTIVEAVNQDIRLSSDASRPVRWLVGAFYQNRKTTQNVFIDGDPAGALSGLTLANQLNRSRSEAYAVYGQVDATLPAGFKLSAALRYDIDKRRDEDLAVPGSTVSDTFKSLQPQLTLSRELATDLNAYATVGRGFRSGGFNSFSVPQNIPGVGRKYQAERTTNYEIGLKAQFFDRGLTVNAAAFHTEFTNEQVNRLLSNPVALAIVNIDSKIDGLEVEITARPVDRLTLTSSVGINHSSIKTALYDGNHTPLSYASTVQAGAEYELPISTEWSALARLDYQRFGPIYYDPANTARYRPTQFVDASLRFQKGDLSIGLWGKNIFSEYSPAIYIPDSFASGIGAVIRNRPASYGIEFRNHF